MHVVLDCPSCPNRFALPQDAPATKALEGLEAGPWFSLGDGETLEDRLYHTLSGQGDVECPECGRPVAVHNQVTLGRLTQELLMQW